MIEKKIFYILKDANNNNYIEKWKNLTLDYVKSSISL